MYARLVRDQFIQTKQIEEETARKRTDVTGRWMGYSADGYGLVEYRGEIFKAKILANTCRQKYALVNLRRTARGNYVDWQ